MIRTIAAALAAFVLLASAAYADEPKPADAKADKKHKKMGKKHKKADKKAADTTKPADAPPAAK
jgi:hypothetical protein